MARLDNKIGQDLVERRDGVLRVRTGVREGGQEGGDCIHAVNGWVVVGSAVVEDACETLSGIAARVASATAFAFTMVTWGRGGGARRRSKGRTVIGLEDLAFLAEAGAGFCHACCVRMLMSEVEEGGASINARESGVDVGVVACTRFKVMFTKIGM